jgi:hypothetical protein
MNTTVFRTIIATLVLPSCAGLATDPLVTGPVAGTQSAPERVADALQPTLYVESRGERDVFRFEACDPPALRLSRGRSVRTDTECRGEAFEVVWSGYLMWPLDKYNHPARLRDIDHLERDDGSRHVAATVDDGGTFVLYLWEFVPSAADVRGYEVRDRRYTTLSSVGTDGDTVGLLTHFLHVDLVEFDGDVLIVASASDLGDPRDVWFVESIANLMPESEPGVTLAEPVLDSARVFIGEAACADVSDGRLFVAMRSVREHSRERNLLIATFEDWRSMNPVENRFVLLPVPKEFAVDVEGGRLSVARRTDTGVERLEYQANGPHWAVQSVRELPVPEAARFWFIDRGAATAGLWVEVAEGGRWLE